MAKRSERWLADSSKDQLISTLTPELAMLRTKAEISQGDLANAIGISRQTYNAIECCARKMTWNTYLSLILYYDYNRKTHQMIRALGIFPQELITRINDGDTENISIESFMNDGTQDVISKLDEQALQSIRTMIMVEYGRCTGLTGDAVVKSFDGMALSQAPISDAEVAAKKALSAIKEKQKK